MTPFAALALYPLLAISNLVAITALRLGRSFGIGLWSLSMMLSLWVVCLVALEHPESAGLSERYLPIGIMLAGPTVHAAADLIPLRKGYLYLAYSYGVLVAALGMLFPRAYYQSGFAGPGPLFWPVAFLSTIAVLWSSLWMLHAARCSEGLMRRRRLALAVGTIFAALGSGAATAGHIFGLLSIAWAAPPLYVAILLVSYAILSGQSGRRRLISQDIVHTLITAVLGSFGVTLYFYLLPILAPDTTLFWILFITFIAALPLDPLRSLLVEFVGRRLFEAPIGLPDMANQIGASNTRADHAEGLAEIGTMASAVAHELRNPLGVIKAQAALLERRGADAKSVARLREQVDRASQFIDDLLHYSRPRPLATELLSVGAKLRMVVDSFQDSHPENSTQIEFAACEGNDEIEADPDALADVHHIILANAIATGCTLIHIDVVSSASAVTVHITDNGPGVPPQLTETLFDPFVTGRGRDTKYPGTGLGLAIAKRWMARHGGTITHETPTNSHGESGARFVLHWPRAMAEHG